MVNPRETEDLAAERTLALSYAPVACRQGLKALLALDARLASIVRAARDPMVGQMRLTWWFEALEALDSVPPPAEPILQALAASVVSRGVGGAWLARMIDGWEVLLAGDPLDPASLALYADARGGTLFHAGAILCGAPGAAVREAGEGWALADLTAHWSNADEASAVRAAAADRLSRAFDRRWPRAVRALGALALSARFDVMPSPPPRAGPRRVARLAWHRWKGT